MSPFQFVRWETARWLPDTGRSLPTAHRFPGILLLARKYKIPANPDITRIRTRAYQSWSRPRIDLTIDHVPLAPTGRYQVLSEFFPNIRDMNVEQIGDRVVFLIEDMFINLGSANHLPLPKREQFEDGVLRAVRTTSAPLQLTFRERVSISIPWIASSGDA